MSLDNTLYFDEVGLRNFLSYGNNDTVINLNNPGTTLIIGEDIDSGTGTSNGAGKSTILNAIVYALFDRPLSKDIKLDELINNINKKNMEVYVKFRKSGVHYKVVRQRKGKDGNTVQLWINDELKTLDSIAQTNDFIAEKILGISYEAFVRIVVFSANHEPFFSLPTSGSAKTTQTDIIEELFSLTTLTLKANRAKADIKENKQKVELIKAKLEQIEKEGVRHKQQVMSIEEKMEAWDIAYASKVLKATETITALENVDFEIEVSRWETIDAIDSRSKAVKDCYERAQDWQDAHDLKMVNVMKDRKRLQGIDFDAEIAMHEKINANQLLIEDISLLAKRHKDWKDGHQKRLNALNAEAESMKGIDFEAQFQMFESMQSFNQEAKEYADRWQQHAGERSIIRTKLEDLGEELEQLSDAKCPYCKQDFHDAKSKAEEIRTEIDNLTTEEAALQTEMDSWKSTSEFVQKTADDIKATLTYPTMAALTKAEAASKSLNSRITAVHEEKDPYVDDLCEKIGLIIRVNDADVRAANTVAELDAEIKSFKPVTAGAATALQMKNDLSTLETRFKELAEEGNPSIPGLAKLLDTKIGNDDDLEVMVHTGLELLMTERKQYVEKVTTPNSKAALLAAQDYGNAKERLEELRDETNPFISTYQELKDMVLDEAEYEEINKLQKIIEHQDMLVKLLTKSDSFVRKALIDKNIPLLNDQLRIYLKKLGLPHRVEFTNTMTAAITQMGRPLSYNNLSTGQKARVNLALSWAFRDVLQKMHSKVSFCLLDEVLDVGLCPYGITSAAKMLKEKAKEDGLTMFIISHRDELNSTFQRNMKVVFERGFSRIADE